MKVTEALASINSAVQVPTNIEYTLRCIGETFETSKASGSMMIVRELEVVEPDVLTIPTPDESTGELKDVMYGFAGTKFKQYLTTKVSDGKGGFDETRTRGAMYRVFKDYEKLGFSGDDIDENNPVLIAKGKLLSFSLRNEEIKFTEKLTEEEVKQGKKFGQGATIIDPKTGKQKVGYKVVLGYLQGVVQG